MYIFGSVKDKFASYSTRYLSLSNVFYNRNYKKTDVQMDEFKGDEQV